MDVLMEKLYGKIGGFLKGVCHPNGDYEKLKNAGLYWVRRDIPFPYEPDGSPNRNYINYKAECERYAENGINHITVTPYPTEFLRRGIDVTTEEGLKKAAEVCAFIANDFKDIKTCWQITNEMHIRHFRAPLNAEQAKNFIIACMKGFNSGDPNAAVGHNSVDREWMEYCKEIDRECDCDFTGVDHYDGTWSDGGPDTYVPWLDEIYENIQKPIILMEFGFASKGGLVLDKDAELNAFAQERGYNTFAEAIHDLDAFIAKFPDRVRRRIQLCAPEDRLGSMYLAMPHVLKKWASNCDVAHTEEGQAEFYDRLLPQLLNHPHLAGAVLYCFSDAEDCFYCDEPDCPCETAWGLLHIDGSEKPSYYAVKRAFNP